MTGDATWPRQTWLAAHERLEPSHSSGAHVRLTGSQTFWVVSPHSSALRQGIGPPPVLALVDDAAVEDAAVDEAAVDEAAVDDAAVEEAAVDDAAVEDAALDEAAVDEAALDDAAVDDAFELDAEVDVAPAPPAPPALDVVPPPAPPVPLVALEMASTNPLLEPVGAVPLAPPVDPGVVVAVVLPDPPVPTGLDPLAQPTRASASAMATRTEEVFTSPSKDAFVTRDLAERAVRITPSWSAGKHGHPGWKRENRPVFDPGS